MQGQLKFGTHEAVSRASFIANAFTQKGCDEWTNNHTSKALRSPSRQIENAMKTYRKWMKKMAQ
jgi:hypothetical protein